MKILFYKVRHFQSKLSQVYTQFCLCIFLLVRKQYLQKKKSDFFIPKISKNFFCQNPFQAILRLKKKWHGPLSHQGGGVKSLVVRPLKKPLFFICVFLKKFSQMSKTYYLPLIITVLRAIHFKLQLHNMHFHEHPYTFECFTSSDFSFLISSICLTTSLTFNIGKILFFFPLL